MQSKYLILKDCISNSINRSNQSYSLYEARQTQIFSGALMSPKQYDSGVRAYKPCGQTVNAHSEY